MVKLQNKILDWMMETGVVNNFLIHRSNAPRWNAKEDAPASS